ncbi:hypothetical protein N7462_001650 [Penicillium macrosclerotiorum]|uniref:uncharacterized protein n=1 Tax=Penicillium macrosclerotiorum TaxID=303699 RepID=UPI0025492F33|nr:uncharacterized protein N7462_001650 [Penicillium macrosclerotiorum]KAJ5692227.1 hypothetical protein N7462_001650 [Penicillium macrosclerotiorum]
MAPMLDWAVASTEVELFVLVVCNEMDAVDGADISEVVKVEVDVVELVRDSVLELDACDVDVVWAVVDELKLSPSGHTPDVQGSLEQHPV